MARLVDDHRQAFFDQLFNPSRQPRVSFGELSDQYLQLTEEDAAANRRSQKWIDKERANLALVREIVGDSTPVDAIDYDTCLRVRSTLARVPANRTKIYGTRPLDEALERAAVEKRPLLSPVTQQQYLAALRDVLDLAAKKRLIPINLAEGLKPIKRDTVAASDKRRPFTLEQIKQFFHSKFYSECAKHPVPFAHDKSGWRFWAIVSSGLDWKPGRLHTDHRQAGLGERAVRRLDRNVQSSKMLHAALLLLMLEAVHTDLVSPSA